MIEIIHDKIDVEKLRSSVADDDCGACVIFTGSTRRWTEDVFTSKLSYEAYEPMALQALQQLSDEAKKRWKIKHVGLIHRLGEVAVGQISVAIAVSSAHREDAFQAAKWLIDTLKRDVPIWKKEFGHDQHSAWVHPSSESNS